MKRLGDSMSMSTVPLTDSAEPYSDKEDESSICQSYQMIMILYHYLVKPCTRSLLLIVSFMLNYTY